MTIAAPALALLPGLGPPGLVALGLVGLGVGIYGGYKWYQSRSESSNDGSETEKANGKADDKAPKGDQKKCTGKCDDEKPSDGNIKKMSDKELEKAARANGYEDAHAMKQDYGLDSKSDIGVDRDGNMYSAPRLKGQGGFQPLGIKKGGS